MVHSILARKRKETKDMEDKIKALTEELRAHKAEGTEIERRLADNNAEKVTTELDGGVKLKRPKIRMFVSAKTARKIAETTSAFKNHIAKIIDETAKEGMTQLIYFVGDICDAQVNRVLSELSALGYEVALNDATQELIIRW